MSEHVQYITIIQAIANLPADSYVEVKHILTKHPLQDGTIPSKSKILKIYNNLLDTGTTVLTPAQEAIFLQHIKKKRVRTLSGVTPLTVLTKPYPCPGQCIFCPNDVRMPKSYIASEPGAQRAHYNNFDPYHQTFNRLVALKNTGHSTDKVELIILGGTWTAYEKDYRLWFIKRCLDALNDFSARIATSPLLPDKIKAPINEGIALEQQKINKLSYNQSVTFAQTTQDYDISVDKLVQAQKINESAKTRCVGMSVETRPDELTPEHIKELRLLGVTKVQLGVQSLSDKVLLKNKRGTTVEQIASAFELLRLCGFKIQIHWMPNLYGSSLDTDIKGYKSLFLDNRFKPDEIKIYPCSLIQNTELEKHYINKTWIPYSTNELVTILADNLASTPRYCRVTRVIRDIPSNEIMDGNKLTNLRQVVEKTLVDSHVPLVEIRSREIRSGVVLENELVFKSTKYFTTCSTEYFLEFVTKSDKLVGFLRLSLPKKPPVITELAGAGIIREIHVYGESLELGHKHGGAAQHIGLGKCLINKAISVAKSGGYVDLAVISSIGTREYYRRNGFYDGDLYQHFKLI